jgi:hypothetical protein
VAAVIVTFTVPLPETVLGEAEQVTLVSVDGTLQETATFLLKPFNACTDRLTEPEFPLVSDRVAAEALSAKSAAGGVLVADEFHSETRLYAFIVPSPVAWS